MKKYMIHALACSCLLIIAYSAVHNPFSLNYLHSMKEDVMLAMAEQDPLKEEIIANANQYKSDPIDARIDRVWKAVPGYNGVEVDVLASYDKMKKLGQYDEKRLVLKEVSPDIHLDDLPPSPIYKGNENKEMVSFLINVAWGNEYIPEILKILNQYSVKATFFLDGSWVKNNPQIALMIKEEGHEIGSHAYSHPDMNTLTRERMDEELQKTNDVIEATLNVTPRWFAPPSGSFNQNVVDRAASFKMNTILWSVDTVDWKKPNPDEMSERVISKVHNGAMILMHPTEATSKGLESIILGILDKELKISTVTDLLAEDRAHLGVTLKQE
ncbi:polysaccharide deacetylase [Bacillus sp. TS-2]|nr:polysaccharide deacetylase [Bacillus sp. TS-2]